MSWTKQLIGWHDCSKNTTLYTFFIYILLRKGFAVFLLHQTYTQHNLKEELIIKFTKKSVDAAPEEHGVYKLYDGDELIYIGRADGKGVTIRSRLQSHFRGDEGRCTEEATSYEREVTEGAKYWEDKLLADYKKAHGKYPRCNDMAA